MLSSYYHVTIAAPIYKLKIFSENKGFGRDVTKLIREKNDYQHARGPSTPEGVSSASDEVWEKLRRCMEALSFLADYPIRETLASGLGGVRGKDLFLELGGDERLPLHPFIVSMTCPDCETEEVYFVDAWDRRRSTARMKSFEKGHTVTDPDISDSLSGWGNPE